MSKLANSASFAFLLAFVMRSVSFEISRFLFLLVFQAFFVVFIKNRLVFSKASFVPFIDNTRLLILRYLFYIMNHLLILALQGNSSDVSFLCWLPAAIILLDTQYPVEEVLATDFGLR